MICFIFLLSGPFLERFSALCLRFNRSSTILSEQQAVLEVYFFRVKCDQQQAILTLLGRFGDLRTEAKEEKSSEFFFVCGHRIVTPCSNTPESFKRGVICYETMGVLILYETNLSAFVHTTFNVANCFLKVFDTRPL